MTATDTPRLLIKYQSGLPRAVYATIIETIVDDLNTLTETQLEWERERERRKVNSYRSLESYLCRWPA
ncbi:hypothetical protein VN97_g4590 [Penicillium thymicola]|uniref:Uncharacterized protein n=1 Tax=Penicillium thymicola TaxID=293382 RepID=A0AAI9X9H8_PENTH|nr:hypothetical protein VN97_g4590 [Penicillium thymicola]